MHIGKQLNSFMYPVEDQIYFYKANKKMVKKLHFFTYKYQSCEYIIVYSFICVGTNFCGMRKTYSQTFDLVVTLMSTYTNIEIRCTL